MTPTETRIAEIYQNIEYDSENVRFLFYQLQATREALIRQAHTVHSLWCIDTGTSDPDTTFETCADQQCLAARKVLGLEGE